MLAINDNTRTKEYGGTYHDYFTLQYPNQYVMDTILTIFALGLPVYDTWRHGFYQLATTICFFRCIHTRTNIYTYTYQNIHIPMYTNIYLYQHVHIHVPTYTCTRTSTYAYTRSNTYMQQHIPTPTRTIIYIYTHQHHAHQSDHTCTIKLECCRVIHTRMLSRHSKLTCIYGDSITIFIPTTGTYLKFR